MSLIWCDQVIEQSSALDHVVAAGARKCADTSKLLTPKLPCERTYIITTSRITSGDESNQRNGSGGGFGRLGEGFIPPPYPAPVSGRLTLD